MIKNILDLYHEMEYGPVVESSKLAEVWLSVGKCGPFVDGIWKEITSCDHSSCYPVKDPCSDKLLATFKNLEPNEINAVINSSLEAHQLWGKLPGQSRAKHLFSISRRIRKNASLLVQVEALNRGVQAKDPREFDVPSVVSYFQYYAGWAKLTEESLENSGIVLGITSGTTSLAALAWTVAPALAAGHTVILKPPRKAPLTAYLLAHICTGAGLPPGVLNVLAGSSEIGRQLVKVALHVTFCGTTAIGRQIKQDVVGLCKPLTLSLSGKTPMVVFDSADLDSAVEGVVEYAWFNQGQVSWCVRTLLVQESIFDVFVDKLKERMKKIRIGEAFDKMADIGLPFSKKVVTDVNDTILQAKMCGKEVFQVDLPKDLSTESYFAPTLLIGSHVESNRLINEDIILPIVSVVPFRTAKEAISLANNTRYGVAASIWTEIIGLALDVAMQLEVGTVWVNCHGMMDASIPFSGWKQSGLGCVGGRQGLLAYLVPQSKAVLPPPIENDCKAVVDNQGENILDTENVQKLESNMANVESKFEYELYYGGSYKRPDSNSSQNVLDYKGNVIGSIAEGSKKDIRNAVEVATAAQHKWWKQGARYRAQILCDITEKLEAMKFSFIRHVETVAPELVHEVESALDVLSYWAACCDKHFSANNFSHESGKTVMTAAEPLGVIGILIDDDSCLESFVEHISAGLCYGNAVIIVPNMKYPTPAMHLCQIFDMCGVPGGVVNVITGDKQTLCSALAHQDVRSLWYCGNDKEMYKSIELASIDNMKRTWIHDKIQGNCIGRDLFQYNATQSKTIWIASGYIFAN